MKRSRILDLSSKGKKDFPFLGEYNTRAMKRSREVTEERA